MKDDGSRLLSVNHWLATWYGEPSFYRHWPASRLTSRRAAAFKNASSTRFTCLRWSALKPHSGDSMYASRSSGSVWKRAPAGGYGRFPCDRRSVGRMELLGPLERNARFEHGCGYGHGVLLEACPIKSMLALTATIMMIRPSRVHSPFAWGYCRKRRLANALPYVMDITRTNRVPIRFSKATMGSAPRCGQRR